MDRSPEGFSTSRVNDLIGLVWSGLGDSKMWTNWKNGRFLKSYLRDSILLSFVCQQTGRKIKSHLRGSIFWGKTFAKKALNNFRFHLIFCFFLGGKFFDKKYFEDTCTNFHFLVSLYGNDKFVWIPRCKSLSHPKIEWRKMYSIKRVRRYTPI